MSKKRGGDLYLIKERGNATIKGRSSGVAEFGGRSLARAFSWLCLTNPPSQLIDGGNSRTESPGTFATF
jgi:hypothetical protein